MSTLFDETEDEPFDPKAALRTSKRLEGLADETVDAICADVTSEMARTFVRCLSASPRHADEVRRDLLWHPWFPSAAKRDTQLRFMRKLRDRAIADGLPVCSMNSGYVLGDWQMVNEAADRAEALARGASQRERMLRRLADTMKKEMVR